MSNKIILIIILLAMALLLHGFITNAYARPMGRTGSSLSGWHYNPAPLTLPPQVPPWFPHGFPHVWSTDDVIKTLNESGLKVNKTSFDSIPSHGNLPVSAKESMNFSVSSSEEEWEGTILSFELKDNLNKIRNYYLGLNDSGELYTWSFVKGNILLVLPGNISEKEAIQYESALNSMKIK